MASFFLPFDCLNGVSGEGREQKAKSNPASSSELNGGWPDLANKNTGYTLTFEF